MEPKFVTFLRQLAAAPLVLAPLCVLLYDPGVIFPFVTPKAAAFHALVLASLAASCLVLLLDAPSRARLKATLGDGLVVAYLLLVLVICLSCLQAPNPMYALLGSAERADGAYMYLTLAHYTVLSGLVMRGPHWRAVLCTLVLAGLVLLAFQLSQHARGEQRPGSLIGQPTFLSAYYALCAGCTLVLCGGSRDGGFGTGTPWRRGALLGRLAVALALMGAFALGVLLTGTRSTALGLAASAALLALLNRDRLGGQGRRWLWASALVAGALALALAWQALGKGVAPRALALLSDNATIGSRLVNYQIALDAVSPLSFGWQRLLLGWGWSNFYLAWDASYLPQIDALDPLPFDKAHNFYLDLLVMCGIMGPAALALLAWRLYQSTFAVAGGLVRAGLLVIFTTHLVEYLFNFDSVPNLISAQVALSYLVYLRLGARA
jgi:hypothetical protein